MISHTHTHREREREREREGDLGTDDVGLAQHGQLHVHVLAALRYA